MLFVLSGDIQCGKTRWLSALAEELEASGVRVGGMLAPGVWRERLAGEYDDGCHRTRPGRYEKLAIDNILLPQHERIRFAERNDALFTSDKDFKYDPNSARLAWSMLQDSVDRVNGHLDDLAEQAAASGPERAETALSGCSGLLIIDELGRLELLRGKGLVSILKLLAVGPTALYPNALVIVREQILFALDEHDFSTWGGYMVIHPDDSGHEAVMKACGLA